MPSTGDYAAKRSFEETPEPPPQATGNVDPGSAPAGVTFMIHQHHARRLHFDLRLEMMNGDTPVLVSWAIPKNLPMTKGRPHLAVHVEDHPIEYGSFEGTIPEGNYGAGEVRIFDAGTYEVLEQQDGKLTLRLNGDRVRGIYHLTRTRSGSGKDEWLVLLKRDERPEPDEPPALSPMLASSAPDAFDDPEWIFEPKWDGVRTLAVCTDETRLVSRTGRDVTSCYPELGRTHERLVCSRAVVDGEIVAFQEGRPSFERLQNRINLQNERDIQRAMKATPVSLILFDVVYLDGRSLVTTPLEERKEILQDLVVPSANVLVSPSVATEGTALAQAASKQQLEGIVAKRRGSIYRPGARSKEWLKIKVVHEADVVIGGWTKGEGSRADSFGALLVGAFSGDELKFLGGVGTGFSQKTIDELLSELTKIESHECPFAGGPSEVRAGRFGKAIRGARWTRPELVAKVEFREITSAPRLRAPSFKGLRRDKPPEQCTLSELLADTGSG